MVHTCIECVNESDDWGNDIFKALKDNILYEALYKSRLLTLLLPVFYCMFYFIFSSSEIITFPLYDGNEESQSLIYNTTATIYCSARPLDGGLDMFWQKDATSVGDTGDL